MLNQNFFYFPLLKFNFNLFNLLLTWMCHHHEQTCHLARPRKPNRKTKKCKLCKNFWTPLKISREDKNPIHPYMYNWYLDLIFPLLQPLCVSNSNPNLLFKFNDWSYGASLTPNMFSIQLKRKNLCGIFLSPSTFTSSMLALKSWSTLAVR